jgi:hypothetical protein
MYEVISNLYFQQRGFHIIMLCHSSYHKPQFAFFSPEH